MVSRLAESATFRRLAHRRLAWYLSLQMVLGRRGWLEALLSEVVGVHRADVHSQSAADAARLPPGHARARCYLRGILRESGVLYGTPPDGAEGDAAPSAPSSEAARSLSLLRTLARIGLDAAVQADAPPGPRKEQLLLVFAALAGRLDDAETVSRGILKPSRGPLVPKSLWLRVEESLERRALSLAGDPYYGLVLHNGAVYADAQLLGRLALTCFTSTGFSRAAMERQLRHAAQQKALLVKVLIGLVCAERPPSFPVRRAVIRQVEGLALPADLTAEARDFAQRAFARAPSMSGVLRGVRSRALRRFILEQTLLASLVDGRRSPREVEWTQALGARLGFTAADLLAVELAMAEYYARNRHVVDVFTLSTGAEVLGEELVDTISTKLRKNYRRLLQEIRETGELSVLLGRAARGKPLSADEKHRMQAQLIDVAKAVPALAIFAAPGGILLLVALAKVLPFDLLPSAFRDEVEPRPSVPPAGATQSQLQPKRR